MLPFALLAALAAAPAPPVCQLPDGARLRLEVAVSDEERAQGLMFRDQLDDDAGMLFVFDRDDQHGFWMKNTFIPLDLVYLTEGLTVVEVLPQVQPCRLDPCPSYTPTRPARHVIEVNAGWAARHGLRPGISLRCSGLHIPTSGESR